MAGHFINGYFVNGRFVDQIFCTKTFLGLTLHEQTFFGFMNEYHAADAMCAEMI